VGVVIITTLLTPPALRYLFAKPAPKVKEIVHTDIIQQQPIDTNSVKGEES
jgi:hypothetical protein